MARRQSHRVPLRTAILLAAVCGAAAAQPAAPAQSPTSYVTRDTDNLWWLSERLGRPASSSQQQWMLATLRRNPQAFVFGNIHRLHSGATLNLPSEAEVAAENPAAAEQVIELHLQAVLRNAPMPALPATLAGVPSTRVAGATTPPAPPLAAPAIQPGAAAPAAAPSSPSASAAPSTADATKTPAPASTPAVASAASAASAAAGGPIASAAGAASDAAPSAAAAATAATATTAAPAVAGATTAPASRGFHFAPLAVAGAAALLLAGSIGFIHRRARQRGTEFTETALTLFQDTIQLVRRSKRKADVSTAAADMARSMEKLAHIDELVRPASGPGVGRSHGRPNSDDAAMWLSMARAQLELGRDAAAQSALRHVMRHGSESQQREARQLMNGLQKAA